MGWTEVISLLIAGFLVGVINTLAGGATVISLTTLMILGLPADVANGTHRLAALFQTFTSTNTFRRQKVLDIRGGWKLAIPSALGSILGAFIAVEIDKEAFMRIAGIVMLIVLVMILLRPRQWLEGSNISATRGSLAQRSVLFFLIGVYGGFIHIGIGYFLIFALVMNAGYDLLHANAVKVMIVFLYVAASLTVFIANGLVSWGYATVIALGQVLGAWIAARSASRWNVNVIRWFMIVFILLSSGYMLGFYDVKAVLERLL